MAESVVDCLEPVQIDHQQSKAVLMHVVFVQRSPQGHLQVTAIGQMRNLVQKGQTLQFFRFTSGRVMSRLVAEDLDRSHNRAVGGPNRLHSHRDRYPSSLRSEERRVGKECRSRWSEYH